MTSAFIAVIQDLWFFIVGTKPALPDTAVSSVLVSTATIPATASDSEVSTPPVLPAAYAPIQNVAPPDGKVAYMQYDFEPCLSEPKIQFDTKLGMFSYGNEVVVSRIEDGYAFVYTPTLAGWVAVEALADQKSSVFPKFFPGVLYDLYHEQTIKLRRYIHDAALGQQLKLPLQSLEFILYTLQLKNASIPWPLERPRAPGRWASLLRGAKGVVIGVEPKTGAVMECVKDAASGWLAIVEEVRPDMSIRIQSIGRHVAGEYLDEVCLQSQWKEWRPVFVTFS